MKGLECRYKVTGEKIKYLLEWLHGKNIGVKNVIFIENGVILTIDNKHRKKLFAISSNMCYNIEKIGYTGKFAPLKVLLERIGIVIGAAAFIFLVYFSDGYVSEITYVGDAPTLRREIDGVLGGEGICVGSRISKEECLRLSEKIMSSSDKFSYVSAVKKGRRLVLEAYMAKGEVNPLDVKRDKIISDVSGKVIKIIAFSGTARVSVGDEVKEGTVLIDASYEFGDKTGETYALGEVEILCVYEFIYTAVGDDEAVQRRAETIAKTNLEDKEIFSVKSEITFGGGEKICKVEIEYKEIIG